MRTASKRQRRVRMLALYAGIVLTLVGVVAWPGVAAAQDPVTVSIYSCARSGGHVTVPAGAPIVFRGGWVDGKRGWVESFLHAQRTVVSVDGAPTDISDLYGPVQPGVFPGLGDVWETYFFYPTGRSLATGESINVELQTWVSHRVRGVYDPVISVPPPWGPLLTFYGPGLILDLNCTITGE